MYARMTALYKQVGCIEAFLAMQEHAKNGTALCGIRMYDTCSTCGLPTRMYIDIDQVRDTKYGLVVTSVVCAAIRYLCGQVGFAVSLGGGQV